MRQKIAAKKDVIESDGHEIDLQTGDITVKAKKDFNDAIAQGDTWSYRWPDEKKEISSSEVFKLRNMLWDWGLIEWGNSYWISDIDNKNHEVTFDQISNFTIRILYHISRGKKSIRIIELKNDRGRKTTIDCETSQISGFTDFVKLVEGQGNFRFWGNTRDHSKLKGFLYEQEKPCVQVETLGWHKKGAFYVFSNGILTLSNKFIPVDEHGIITRDDVNYFIPSHPNSEESLFLNEKRFTYKKERDTFSLSPSLSGQSIKQPFVCKHRTNFKEWSYLYYESFGSVGMVCQIFAISCIFSDIIYKEKNNFPMIFLYGEGGSGKSTVVNFIQYLFGEPQPALKLSEKANTDKAKIRKLAQFVNAVGCLEEFMNSVDMGIIKTITGIYDRFGYERSSMESKYGTETVPISSGVFITGNEYPSDDPLMQRLVLMDYNSNVRTAKVVDAFEKLRTLNERGITCVLGEILQYRELFKEKFYAEYKIQLQAIKNNSGSIQCPDRMRENNAVILATYKVMSKKLTFPYTYEELFAFTIKSLGIQASKRDTGSITQRFWDLVLHLLNTKQISHNREIKVDGNRIKIRYKELYMLYNQAHYIQHRTNGQSYASMLQKLKDSDAYIGSKDGERFNNSNTSCFVFDYNKIGVDLVLGINSDDELAEMDKKAPELLGQIQQVQQNGINNEPPF